MFLHPKAVANTNRYVENSPENRNPVFKHDFRGRVEFSEGILRYSTTSAPVDPSPVPVNRGQALAAMARIASARN